MDNRFDQSIAPMKVRSQSRSVSRPREKTPVRQRTPKRRGYVLNMSPGKDIQPNPKRSPDRARALSAWIESVFILFRDEIGWSRSQVIRQSEVSKSAVYRWKDSSENGQNPEPELLDRFCANLHKKIESPLLDPAVPYGILGWGKPGSMAGARIEALLAATPTDLEGKIRRARKILQGDSLTPAQRERYKGMLTDFETAYERVIDTIIADLEPGEAPIVDRPDGDS